MKEVDSVGLLSMLSWISVASALVVSFGGFLDGETHQKDLSLPLMLLGVMGNTVCSAVRRIESQLREIRQKVNEFEHSVADMGR